MNDIDELKLILEHREQQWLQHCNFVLEKILLPLCREGLALSQSPSKRAAVLIENRINHQWLFTVAKHLAYVPTRHRTAAYYRSSQPC